MQPRGIRPGSKCQGIPTMAPFEGFRGCSAAVARPRAALLLLLGLGTLTRRMLAASQQRPPRLQPQYRDYGGGSPELPGHGLPMQAQPGATPVEELQEVPDW